MSVDDDDDDDMMAMGDSTTATTTTAAAAMQNMSDENPNGYNNNNININNNNNDNDLYEEIREQDRYLPIANIARIMKNTLPENAKIAKESKETVQECVSEFISFITSEASDKCLQEKRKTINGDDLLWAMSTLGFDKYVEPLKEYLKKYRDTVSDSKKATKGGNNE